MKKMFLKKIVITIATFVIPSSVFAINISIVDIDTYIADKYYKPLDPESNPLVFTLGGFGKLIYGGMDELGLEYPKMNELLASEITFIESSFQLENAYHPALQVVPKTTKHGHRAYRIHAYRSSSPIYPLGSSLLFERGANPGICESRKFKKTRLLGLEILDLDGCSANMKDLERLLGHCPNIKILHLPPSLDLSKVKLNLPESIQELSVADSSLGEEFFQSLANMKALEKLRLRGCRIPISDVRNGTSTQKNIQMIMARLKSAELFFCSSSIDSLFFSSAESSVEQLSVVSDYVAVLNNLNVVNVLPSNKTFSERFPDLKNLEIKLINNHTMLDSIERIWLKKYSDYLPKNLSTVTLILGPPVNGERFQRK